MHNDEELRLTERPDRQTMDPFSSGRNRFARAALEFTRHAGRERGGPRWSKVGLCLPALQNVLSLRGPALAGRSAATVNRPRPRAGAPPRAPNHGSAAGRTFPAMAAVPPGATRCRQRSSRR